MGIRRKERDKMKKMSLAKKMFIAMMMGLIVGVGFLVLRESLVSSGKIETWNMINNLLFQDINAPGAERAIGLFYIVGQLFINSLQLVIIPMVFVSIVLAVSGISDTKTLGRISMKTVGFFLMTTTIALIFAALVGVTVYSMGLFNMPSVGELSVGATATGSNPLTIILKIIPNNIIAVFGDNSRVLAVVFLAAVIGVELNQINDESIKNLCESGSKLITIFLNVIIEKVGPIAIFCLLSRTFAIYGIEHLKPAMVYIVTVVIALLFFLIVVYAVIISCFAKVSPLPFMKKIAKVAMFGFSTSSSAATLPINQQVAVDEMGASEKVSSFVLPLGMTINMDGTAIMQVIAAIFIAGSAGYELTLSSVILIGVLALVASIGTPAAPGAGAIILFTVLSGVGITNEAALVAYSLILAINRPVEMLVTALNVVGDNAAAIVIAKSEGEFNEEVYEVDAN